MMHNWSKLIKVQLWLTSARLNPLMDFISKVEKRRVSILEEPEP